MKIETIPQELKLGALWCLWRYEERKGKRTKPPYSPKTLQLGDSSNPNTFTDFEAAYSVFCRGGFEGMGIGMFGGLCAVDIDHCVTGGEISPMAQDIIATMQSYTEISPSGEGVRIIFLTEGYQYDKECFYINNAKAGLEVYISGCTNKYVTITGNALNAAPIRDCSKTITQVLEKYMRRQGKTAPAGGNQMSNSTPSSPVAYLGDELLTVGLQKDRTLKTLWDGARPNGNESADDLALLNKLAYWCDRNEAAVTKAFLSSPHYCSKDDEHKAKIARKDYLPDTVRKAIGDCTVTAGEKNSEYARRQQVKRDRIKTDTGGVLNLEALEKQAYSDRKTAELFAMAYGGKVAYVPEYKCYWAYSMGRWVRDVDNVIIRAVVKDFTKACQVLIPSPPPAGQKKDGAVNLNLEEQPADKYKNLRGYYRKYEAYKNRDTLVKDAKDSLAAYSKDFDIQANLFNCQNGTLNLDTMELKPHQAGDRITKISNVVYAPEADCPRFLQFLSEITEGNKERGEMLQKSLGYALRGEANEECCFLALGETTRNGKGTLFDSVLWLMGDYAAQIDFATIARTKSVDGSRASPDIARLVGKRLVLSNEPEKGVCFNEAFLKQITGNDNITARPLYAETIEYKPIFKLFITANSRPTVADDSVFTSGRIKILPFTKHFSEEERDTSLKALFRSEEAKSAIFNWLLEGYVRYRREGLKDTDEMRRMTLRYQKDNDSMGEFIRERLDLTTHETTRFSDLMRSYRFWCEDNGLKPLGRKQFREEISKKNITVRELHGQDFFFGSIRNN